MKGKQMLIRNVTLAQWTEVVRTVSDSAYGGNIIVNPDTSESGVRVKRVTGRVRVVSSREAGARCSWSGRRTVSACWHAHRDLFRELFAQYPDATVQTVMASYTAQNFESEYPRTAYRNIGSLAAPANMPSLCEC